MSDVYSLICWGGKDGKTVSGSSATTDRITVTGHGIRAGYPMALQFSAGTLMTGASVSLALNMTYWAKYYDANDLELYTTSALTTRITWTGAGSGLTVKSAFWQGLTTAQKLRYGTAGSERAYDGIKSFRDARYSAAGAYDNEFCEFSGAFDDLITASLELNIPAQSVTMNPRIDGVLSDAFSGGIFGAGYRLITAIEYADIIKMTGNRHTLDMLSIKSTVNNSICVLIQGVFNSVTNCIFDGANLYNIGFRAQGYATVLFNNVAIQAGNIAFDFIDYSGNASIYANNQAHKSGIGFKAGGSNATAGWWYNNMSVGNTTNWSGTPSTAAGQAIAANNYGASGDTGASSPWYTGTDTAIRTMTTSHFVDYANNDFRPTSGSPVKDTAIVVIGMDAADIVGDLRPSYNNGGAEAWDGGAFEYDNGYGLPPEVHTIDFSGLIAGSQVIVYTTGTTTELFRDDNCSATESYDGGNGAIVDYTILKAGYIPIRATGVALTATSTPVSVAQQLDRAYVAPSGLTFGTNVIVNVSALAVTSMQVTVATTVQNWYSYLIDSFIASSTNTTLKNVDFPVIPFGEASFTLINGIQFSDGATSISKFKRDGLRYSSNAGTTITAIWAAILTLNTPAGQQVKYRQSPAGAISSAANTGPMDQLVQVMSDPNGDGSYGDGYDYRGHMVLRAPKPGWSQPKPDLVATYGNLVDGLFVAALEPVLQYATTDADIDAANLALDNTAKTYTVTAAHTMAELYQRAQWWANQDAQWDADIPLTTSDGSTFVQPSNWSVIGVANLTGGTLSGGSATLAAGTQGISYNAVIMNMGAAGTYTFVMAGSSTVRMTPTAPGTYNFTSSSFVGTVDLRNLSGTHAITVELPSGAAYTTASNTGAAITVTYPVISASISISGMPVASGASRRLQIMNQTALTAAARANSTAYSLGAIRLRQTDIGTENTAGLYLRCTTAGTSAGSPPTWNTTPGGTTTDGSVVWTTYAVLYYDADPASTSLTDTYTEGEEFLAGETVEVRFAEMDAGTSFKTFDTTTIASDSGFSVAVNEEADDVYASNGLDGSSYETTYSPNFTDNYIVLDTNTDFAGVSAYAYFCYTLTSSNGMYRFWGGVTALDTGNYRIESDILNLYFDETTGFVKQTDNVRVFRKDGTRPALDPTTGGNGIEINWRTPVSVVSTGGSALTPTESSHLLGLTNAPSAATVASTVLSAAETTPIAANIEKVNAITITGVGTAGNPWGPA